MAGVGPGYYKLAGDDPQNENSTEVTELADC